MAFDGATLGWYSSMILLIPAFLFASYAQLKVKSNFSRFSRVRSMRGISGAQAARRMLDANGLQHVRINMISGNLTDHYNPGNQTINLSADVYNGDSIAALGVACHECGHAVQHSESYAPLTLRNAIVPVTNFASGIAIPLFIAGLVMGWAGLEILGILFFSCAVIFQAITLPVEFNASRRALVQMENLGLVFDSEIPGAKKVLGAAALTYVAALLVSLMQLVRLILLSRARR